MIVKSYQLLGLINRKTGQLSPVSPNLLAYSSWKMSCLQSLWLHLTYTFISLNYKAILPLTNKNDNQKKIMRCSTMGT